MKLTYRLLLLAFLVLPGIASAQYYDYLGNPEPTYDRPSTANIKTNLLYDITSTINLGMEFRLGNRTSLDIPINYNPWTFQNNRKWKHVLLQPELRWWLRRTFEGHFFGLHAHWGYYNIAKLPEPFAPHMQKYRFEGQLYGGGVSYGYRWNFSDRVAMEATLGAGVAVLDYKRYGCDNCGTYIEDTSRLWIGPTKIGINLIISLGGDNPARKKKEKAGYYDPIYAPVTAPILEQPYSTPPYVLNLSGRPISPNCRRATSCPMSKRSRRGRSPAPHSSTSCRAIGG